MKNIYLLVILAFISGCSWDSECKSMPISKLSDASFYFLIEDYEWGEIKVVNSQKISEVVASIENLHGRWANPWYGAPLGRYGAIFYDSEYEKINEYRITPKRVELVGCGDENYMRITDSQRTSLLKVLGLKDPYIQKERVHGNLDRFIDLVEEW
jgi:hypothetical protein